MLTYTAKCHCDNIELKILLPSPIDNLIECNCSICAATGYLHLHVSADQIEFVNWGKDIVEYKFNTGEAEHYFCCVCGVKPVYKPRSHPHGFSVNGRCIVDLDLTQISILKHDGQNWKSSVSTLPEHPIDF